MSLFGETATWQLRPEIKNGFNQLDYLPQEWLGVEWVKEEMECQWANGPWVSEAHLCPGWCIYQRLGRRFRAQIFLCMEYCGLAWHTVKQNDGMVLRKPDSCFLKLGKSFQLRIPFLTLGEGNGQELSKISTSSLILIQITIWCLFRVLEESQLEWRISNTSNILFWKVHLISNSHTK